MNHAQIKAFHAVAEQASFTRAARQLGVSQPTLSGHVAALEQAYGVDLFRRVGRRVEITEFGRTLLEAARVYFAAETEVTRLLQAARGLAGGRLAMMADSPHYVMPLLAGFRARHPGVATTLAFGNSAMVTEAVLAGHADAGIRAGYSGADTRLGALALVRDRVVLVVPRDHPWTQRRNVRLADLAGQMLLSREPGSATRTLFEQALSAAGIVPASVMEIGSREAMREAAAAGLGIGYVNEMEFGQDARLARAVMADARIEVTETLIWRRAARLAPVLEALIEAARLQAS